MKLADGWYKLTGENDTYVRHFQDGLSAMGFGAEQWERIGYTFEPVVVLTVAEYNALMSERLDNEFAWKLDEYTRRMSEGVAK